MRSALTNYSRRAQRSVIGHFDRWILVVSVCVVAMEILVIPLLPFAVELIPPRGIPEAKAQLLKLYNDRVWDLIVLAVTIAGGAAGAAYTRWKNQTLSDEHLRILKSCWMLVGLSVCSGILGLYHLQRLLERRVLDPSVIPLTSYPALIQIISFFAAGPFLVWFVVIALRTNQHQAHGNE